MALGKSDYELLRTLLDPTLTLHEACKESGVNTVKPEEKTALEREEKKGNGQVRLYACDEDGR
jgi:hypothetical protein